MNDVLVISRTINSISAPPLTVLHGHALVLNAAHVTAQLVLPLGVLGQLGLHAEAPHLLKGRALQLHLVQDLGAHLHHLVRVELRTNITISQKGFSIAESSCVRGEWLVPAIGHQHCRSSSVYVCIQALQKSVFTRLVCLLLI